MILLEIDPNVVKPGWTPLVITVLLGAAIVFLYFSMRKQFRRINVPDADAENAPEATDVAYVDPPAPADQSPLDLNSGTRTVDITKPVPGPDR